MATATWNIHKEYVVPAIYQDEITPHIPDALRPKVYFLENDCTDIWKWAEKVYEYAKSIS